MALFVGIIDSKPALRLLATFLREIDCSLRRGGLTYAIHCAPTYGTSQMRTVWSSLAEAMRVPVGDQATALTADVWAS